MKNDLLILRPCTCGQGVFAARPIRAGQHIIQFTGPLLRQNQTTMETYALQIGPDLYIGPSGSFDDYINHSCDPNCGMIIHAQTANLHALRDIAEGEQITFDYSTVMAEEGWVMPCLCGAATCRRIIRTGKHLPEHLKQRYQALGMLPAYNR